MTGATSVSIPGGPSFSASNVTLIAIVSIILIVVAVIAYVVWQAIQGVSSVGQQVVHDWNTFIGEVRGAIGAIDSNLTQILNDIELIPLIPTVKAMQNEVGALEAAAQKAAGDKSVSEAQSLFASTYAIINQTNSLRNAGQQTSVVNAIADNILREVQGIQSALDKVIAGTSE